MLLRAAVLTAAAALSVATVARAAPFSSWAGKRSLSPSSSSPSSTSSAAQARRVVDPALLLREIYMLEVNNYSGAHF